MQAQRPWLHLSNLLHSWLWWHSQWNREQRPSWQKQSSFCELLKKNQSKHLVSGIIPATTILIWLTISVELLNLRPQWTWLDTLAKVADVGHVHALDVLQLLVVVAVPGEVADKCRRGDGGLQNIFCTDWHQEYNHDIIFQWSCHPQRMKVK